MKKKLEENQDDFELNDNGKSEQNIDVKEIKDEIKGVHRKMNAVIWSSIGVGVLGIALGIGLWGGLNQKEYYTVSFDHQNEFSNSLSGEGKYKDGTKVTIKAEEVEGFRFVNWTLNDEIVSTDSEYTFVIDKNTNGTYTANYAQIFSAVIDDESTQTAYGTVSLDKNEAIYGENVVVNAVANEDYSVARVYYVCEGTDASVSENQIEVSLTDGVYAFAMPESNVKVFVEYLSNQPVVLTLSVSGVNQQISVPRGSKLGDVLPEGYDYFTTCGFYSNEKLTYPIELDEKINEDITVYTKMATLEKIRMVVDNDGDYAVKRCAQNPIPTCAGEIVIPRKMKITITENDQEVEVEKDVKKIGSGAFDRLTKTTSIVLPYGIEYIGKDSFYDVPLVELNLPLTLKTLEEYGIRRISTIKSIYIPASVENIGECNFWQSGSYEEIIVDENNKNYVSVDGVLYNKDKTTLMYYPANKSGDHFTIPDSVTKIADSCFSINKNLTTIDIPVGIKNISRESFTGSNFFANIKAKNEGIYESNGVVYAFGPSSIEITSLDLTGVNIIVGGAYSTCQKLTEVIIPDSVTEIGDFAFQNCYTLANVVIGNNVKTIGNRAFQWAERLQTLTMGENVEFIGSQAFYYCSKFTSATFKDIEGWFIADDKNMTNAVELSKEDVGDPSKIAVYLKNTYCAKYFIKMK